MFVWTSFAIEFNIAYIRYYSDQYTYFLSMKLSFYGKQLSIPTVAPDALEPKLIYTIEASSRDLAGKQLLEVKDQEVLELDFEDGSSWWLGPEDLAHLRGSQNRAITGEEVIELSPYLNFGTQDRALGGLLLRGFKVFAKPVAEVTADWTARQVESKLVAEEGVYQVKQDFSLIPVLPEEIGGGDSSILLFIHGTASNFIGSFGQLKNADLWTKLQEQYNGQIFAFDHHTLSKSPVQNVLNLLAGLPDGIRLDLVTHSRGGIVGDFLARFATEASAFTQEEIQLVTDTDFIDEAELLVKLNELAEKRQLSIEKYVRVACPSQGTTLMTDRLDILLNVLLSLMTKASGADVFPPVTALKELLLATISERTNPKVLPGLAAMQPDTAFQRLLNSTQVKLSSQLSIIAGAHGSGNWKQSLMHFITKLFFRGPNDYVIDTKAKYAGFPRIDPTYFCLFESGDVHHFRYFLNEDSREAIWVALNAKNGTVPRGFEVVTEKNKSGSRAGRKEKVITGNPYSLIATWAANSEQHDFDTNQNMDPVKVTLKMGHMKYANYPIMVGHFQDDGIVSAESVLDSLLGNKLSESHRLGIYPGPPNTSRIVPPNADRKMGAIIVGLGLPEDLSSLVLAQTVEKACLEYLDSSAERGHAADASLGITSLMIGSGYGNLTLSASINAILEGVFAANRKVLAIKQLNTTLESDRSVGESWELPLITEIEFIEIFRNKARDAFYLLHHVSKEKNHFNIELYDDIIAVQGSRNLLLSGEEKNWWMRLGIQYNDQDESFVYSASTGRARVSNRITRIRQSSIHKIIKDSDFKSGWNREVSRTLFEMLVPNDFKLAFRNQKNILLVLDKTMAEYPWELLHYDNESGTPLCTRTGFIRQLATHHDRPILNQVYQQTALVVGDPYLHGKFPQLPGALKEADQVAELLHPDFEVKLLRQPSFVRFATEFYLPYKLVHIASHGVVEYDVDGRKETGILLENGEVFTPNYIQQSSSTPEFVFLNCCHLGNIDSNKEAYAQERSRLAANLGTQFIENGVKAVIVAGWAVDDAAAQKFAAVFYARMMDGYTFGKAVQEARAECYRKFPGTNTWGAYQCYGDQFYTLAPRKHKRGETELSYLLPQEAIIDLELLLDDTRSVRKRNGNLLVRLEQIMEVVNKQPDKLRKPQVVELEAAVYAELGAYAKAAEAYRSLWTMSKADWVFSSLEQYHNVSMAALWQEFRTQEEPDRPAILAEMKEHLKELRGLLKLGATTERFNLLGSAHKRCFLVETEPDRREKHWKAALRYYNEARKTAEARDHKDHYYSLCNWLYLAEIVSPERIQEKLGGRTSLEYLKEHADQLTQSRGIRTEFWDEVRLVNVFTALLLANAEEDHVKTTVGEIKKAYQQAWNVGGSVRNRDSEIFQMSFISELLKESKHSDQIKRDLQRQSFEELCAFFNDLK